MRTFIYRVAPILVAASIFAASQADVLWNQSWDGGSNLFASQNDTSGGNGNFATTYDNFTLSAESEVNDVQFTGGYFNPGQQGAIAGFTLTFYADASGIPGNAIAAGFFTSFNETSLGSVNDFPIFSYDLGFQDFDMAAGTYWLSVVPDMGFPPQWGWATGTGGDGNAYQSFFGVGGPTGSDMAFTIGGHANVLTPEPITMSLGFAGIGLFVRRRKARQS